MYAYISHIRKFMHQTYKERTHGVAAPGLWMRANPAHEATHYILARHLDRRNYLSGYGAGDFCRSRTGKAPGLAAVAPVERIRWTEVNPILQC